MPAAGLPACIGHRGLPLLYPENTLPSFLAALDAGADGIELDIRLTSDKEVVVLHDTTLDRTTSSTGPVSSYSLEQLRVVLAHSTFLGLEECFPLRQVAACATASVTESVPTLPILYAPIPRLVDVFELLLAYPRQDVTCIIDVKWDNPLSIMFHLRRILELPVYACLLPRITIGIWSPLFIPFFPPRSMPVRRSFIGSSRLLARIMSPFIDTFSLDKDVVLAYPDFVRTLSSGGTKMVTVWTTDNVNDIGRVLSLQVDGIIGDCVPLCIAVACPGISYSDAPAAAVKSMARQSSAPNVPTLPIESLSRALGVLRNSDLEHATTTSDQSHHLAASSPSVLT